MKILIVYNTIIPAIKYGGIERVMWDLGKELNKLGHKVSYLVAKGSTCPFAEEVYEYDPSIDINEQIPNSIDVIHLNSQSDSIQNKPYISTFHGNVNNEFTFDKNTVFVSQNQATRYHGSVYVHNGLDWDRYEKPQLGVDRKYFHFLGDASWKVKNVVGAVQITKKAEEKLVVLGGNRLNLNMGIRFTPDLHVSFKGSVDNFQKAKYLNKSKGMIFPALWHEPFGLAIIESIYFGCPVFGSTYGSLPELIPAPIGILSNSINTLAGSLKNASLFSPKLLNEYAATNFNSQVMAKQYINLYEKVMNGESLHSTSPYLNTEGITPKRFKLDS